MVMTERKTVMAQLVMCTYAVPMEVSTNHYNVSEVSMKEPIMMVVLVLMPTWLAATF